MFLTDLLGNMERSQNINLKSVGYIVDPPYFTGKMVTQSSLKIPQEINVYNGRTLRVAYLQFSPYLFGSSNSHLDGMQYIHVTELAARANHTVIFYDNLKSPGYGRPMNYGSWTGLIGEIKEGRADMAATLGTTVQAFYGAGHGHKFVYRANRNVREVTSNLLPVACAGRSAYTFCVAMHVSHFSCVHFNIFN